MLSSTSSLFLMFQFFGTVFMGAGQVVEHFEMTQNLVRRRNTPESAEMWTKLAGKSVFEQIVNVFGSNNVKTLQLDDSSGLQNLTLECVEDMSLLYVVMTNASLVAPDFLSVFEQMKDAQGVLPAGMRRGANTAYGFKQECDIIKYKIPNQSRQFETMYGRIYFDVVALSGGNKTCDYSTFMGFDVCLPKSCGREDLIDITSAVNLLSILDPSLSGENPTCTVATMDSVKTEYSYKSWITITILGIVIFFAVLATVMDYFFIPLGHKVRFEQPLNLLLAFSLYTNVSEIMTVKKTNQPGQISTIHFIRVVSITWVMMAHVFLEYTNLNNNILDFMGILDYIPTQIILNGYFSVDNFFFIGAVLLSFIFFKELDRNRKSVMSFQGWFMFYFHRYVRLSPSYFMAIAVVTWIYYPLTDHYTRRLTPEYMPDSCNTYMWRNVLYINNLDVTKACFGQSWYLAADMQMYVLSPVLLVALALSPIGGVVVGVILIFLSTAGNITTVYINHYPPAPPILRPLKDMNHYMDNMYYAMWIRCQVYIMGILVGYLLQKKKRLSIPRIVQILGWILTISLMGTVLFGLYRYNKNEVEISLFWAAMYSSLAKIAWGLGLGWIIVACFYGYGGFLNRFMSWNIWVPLSRVSYAAYLIHYCILDFVNIQSNNAVIYTNVFDVLLYYGIPVVCLTFLLSVFWSSLFEMSIAKIEMILLRPAKSPAKQKTGQKENGNLKTNSPEDGISQWIDESDVIKKL